MNLNWGYSRHYVEGQVGVRCLRNQKLQQRLLAESNLTFTKAFGLAQTAELSEQNAEDLQRPETMEVHVRGGRRI